MGEIISILQESVRPYEWAKAEMTENFPDPDKFWITKLDKLKLPQNVHVSIFHDPEGKLDIWRVYWSDTDSVKYSILLNYDKLSLIYPDIVKMLELNGVAAYEQELQRARRYNAQYGESRKVFYRPLQPFKF